ncbi:hypothetical protein B0H14DRAFT_2616467 [Mycena olivaceomarginata]|nr:hypothetical protein B0H14DRAFT_2616467 [Mycena olivaceomarginata]
MPSLLLLWLLHLVALNCPVLGHPLCSREAPIPSDPDVDTRTLFNIISGCLATVFACTWISVHPNVPGPGQGKLARAGRRLGLMLVAVIAPELMAGFAARQFLDARWFSKKYDVSLAHGFFFAMGGFVSAHGHHPIVTEEQLRLHPEYLAAIQSIREEDIEDKSKGDSLSKGMVLLQGLWFTAQCLARVQQHLPLTELEVATLAFQFVSIFIWLLWWKKPLDVQQPQPIVLQVEPANSDEVFFRPFLVKASHWLSESRSVVNANANAILMGDYPDFEPLASTSVPSFWSTHGGLGLSAVELGLSVEESPGQPCHGIRFASKFIPIQLLIGTVFGGLIHCWAWDEHFPSTAELLIWRFCLLVIAATPFSITRSAAETVAKISPITTYAALVSYIGARLLLIVVSFTTLRALPPGAFVDVNWSAYIPHL